MTLSACACNIDLLPPTHVVGDCPCYAGWNNTWYECRFCMLLDDVPQESLIHALDQEADKMLTHVCAVTGCLGSPSLSA